MNKIIKLDKKELNVVSGGDNIKPCACVVVEISPYSVDGNVLNMYRKNNIIQAGRVYKEECKCHCCILPNARGYFWGKGAWGKSPWKDMSIFYKC